MPIHVNQNLIKFRHIQHDLSITVCKISKNTLANRAVDMFWLCMFSLSIKCWLNSPAARDSLFMYHEKVSMY